MRVELTPTKAPNGAFEVTRGTKPESDWMAMTRASGKAIIRLSVYPLKSPVQSANTRDSRMGASLCPPRQESSAARDDRALRCRGETMLSLKTASMDTVGLRSGCHGWRRMLTGSESRARNGQRHGQQSTAV